jgi:hypothetical protein
MTALTDAAEFAASEPDKANKRWFEYNKEVLMEAIDERNRLLHSMKQKTLTDRERRDITINLKELKNWIDDQTRVAEERWAQALAESIHCLKFDPKKAWEDIINTAKAN